MARNSRPARARRNGAKQAEAALIESPLQDSATYLVRFAQLRAFDEFHHQFAGFGITPARFAVFALIVENTGIRPGTIADHLNVKSSNVASIVNHLVARGLVERRQDAAELRANKLLATPAGRKAFKDMWQEHQHMDASFLQPLTAGEKKTFMRLLRKIL